LLGLRKGERNPRASGQLLERLRKAQVIVLHEKTKRVARRAASEAVVDAAIGIHRKRRGLLLMERAKPDESTAAFLQRDISADDLDDVAAVANFLNHCLRNDAHDSPSSVQNGDGHAASTFR